MNFLFMMNTDIKISRIVKMQVITNLSGPIKNERKPFEKGEMINT